MRRGGRIFILLGIILAIAAAAVTFRMLQQPAAQPGVQTQKVVVAAQDIPKGNTLSPDVVELKELPANLVPAGAMSNPADVTGKLARSDIFKGQVILQAVLVDKETMAKEGGVASLMIPKGKVAIAFPIDTLSGVAYALQPGDRVDVLITLQIVDLDPTTQVKLPLPVEGEKVGEQRPRLVTQLTLQNVEVLRVGPWLEGVMAQEMTKQVRAGEEASPQIPEVVTLLVDQQDALVLKFARESGARIDLVLRAAGDEDIVTTEAVTLDYILARFNIPIPPKTSYGVERYKEQE